MTSRTLKTTVTFENAFTLGDLKEVLPPGTYDVETDEELIEGLSFRAYRRVAAVIHLPTKSGVPGLTRSLSIDPKALDDALERDLDPTEGPAHAPSRFHGAKLDDGPTDRADDEDVAASPR